MRKVKWGAVTLLVLALVIGGIRVLVQPGERSLLTNSYKAVAHVLVGALIPAAWAKLGLERVLF